LNAESDIPDLSQLWSLLFQIVADVEKRLQAHMAAHNLTPPQFYVLKALVEQGMQCSIGDIARELHLTSATMTGIINRLEAMDPALVNRSRSEADRRSVTVTLTEAGMERFMAVQAGLMAHVAEMLDLLDDRGKQDLITYAALYVNEVINRFPVSDIS
jgi:DNA-binding MarR family transcriptional regulator